MPRLSAISGTDSTNWASRSVAADRLHSPTWRAGDLTKSSSQPEFARAISTFQVRITHRL